MNKYGYSKKQPPDSYKNKKITRNKISQEQQCIAVTVPNIQGTTHKMDRLLKTHRILPVFTTQKTTLLLPYKERKTPVEDTM